MAGTGVGFSLSGDWAKLDRVLKRAAGPGAFGRATKRIAEHGVSSTKLRFQDQKDPQGRPWIPSDRVLTRGGKTLVDTARLRNSITGKSDAAQAEWGTNVVYAATHQYGRVIRRSRSGGGSIPARPFIGINRDDREAIEEILRDVFGGVL